MCDLGRGKGYIALFEIYLWLRHEGTIQEMKFQTPAVILKNLEDPTIAGPSSSEYRFLTDRLSRLRDLTKLTEDGTLHKVFSDRHVAPIEFSFLPMIVHHWYQQDNGVLLEIIEKFRKMTYDKFAGKIMRNAKGAGLPTDQRLTIRNLPWPVTSVRYIEELACVRPRCSLDRMWMALTNSHFPQQIQAFIARGYLRRGWQGPPTGRSTSRRPLGGQLAAGVALLRALARRLRAPERRRTLHGVHVCRSPGLDSGLDLRRGCPAQAAAGRRTRAGGEAHRKRRRRVRLAVGVHVLRRDAEAVAKAGPATAGAVSRFAGT